MMTMLELTNRLQTLCHEGYSNTTVRVNVLEAVHDINDVYKVFCGSDEEPAYFTIDTEPLAER